MHVLDTDTLTLLHFGHQHVTQRMTQIASDDLAITSITQIEALRGRYERLMKATTVDQLVGAQVRLNQTERFLRDFIVLPVTRPTAEMFERLGKDRKARNIGHADLLIASIVLVNNAVLVTRNLRDFRKVPNLRLENWIDD